MLAVFDWIRGEKTDFSVQRLRPYEGEGKPWFAVTGRGFVSVIRLKPVTGRRTPNQLPLTLEEMAFQMRGNVAHVCPRCWGRKAKSTTLPRPTFTSASAI
jgi:hypothetical protein